MKLNMRNLFKTYQNCLARFPIATQAIQTGILMGTGDVIAQVFIEKKYLNEVDLIRVGQFTAVGTVFVGPPLRIWYGIMDKYIGNSGKTVALKKVALDQFVFAPSFIAAIMAIVHFVQGNPLEVIKEKIKRDYPDVLKNNYKLWPAVQLCNFYLVPLQYQVMTVQLVAIFWNTYLSWKMNQSIQIKTIV